MTRVLMGKYEIVRVIGRGGMGTVYEGREIGSGRPVAVKWMHERSIADDDPNLIRFQQEARIAGKLDSPHVTAVYECAKEPEKNVLFLVMELLEGEDVRVLVDRVGALPPDVAVRIAVQACAGLAAAHKAGVVHRDIKPENLFLAKKNDGRVIVKVLDFGIAKIRRSPEAGAGTQASVHAMTATGDLLGTPLYMAPEQFEGAKHVDARADVYSMGVVLYTLLAGAAPHAHLKSFMQILRAITTQPPMLVTQRAPWVSPQLAAIVTRAMSVDPAARYANAGELHAALIDLLQGQTDLRDELLVGLTDEQKSGVGALNQADAMAQTIAEPKRTDEQPVAVPNTRSTWWRRLLGH